MKQLQLAVVDGIKNYAVNEAKRIGTDLIKKKGGEFLAKMTGTDPLDSKRLAPQSKGCFLSTLVKYCIYDTALLTWHVGLAHVTLYVHIPARHAELTEQREEGGDEEEHALASPSEGRASSVERVGLEPEVFTGTQCVCAL